MVNLNDPQVIEQIMRQTNQAWRKCKRKQYNIYASKMPKDVVFANKLEQPDSYRAMKSILRKSIATVEECKKHPELMQVLGQYGFYQTDGNCITLCGTAGELWTVKEEKLKQSYRLPDGRQITNIPDGWFTVSRAAEATAQALGIQIPSKILGVYQTSWATLQVNNPHSEGHHSGDILVVPLVNGQPDFGHCSPTNNSVFANTYDLTVGSWAKSGLIKTSAVKLFTLEECKRVYNFNSIGGVFSKDNISKMLARLNSNNLGIRFDADDRDTPDTETVWFMPHSSEVRWLYKGFYLGLSTTTKNSFVAEVRNGFGDDYDYEKECANVSESLDYLVHFMQHAKTSYNNLLGLCREVIKLYGSKSYMEEMSTSDNLCEEGEYAGLYIGLSDKLANALHLADKNSAYIGVRYDIAKPNSNPDKLVISYSILVQGDSIDIPINVKDNTAKGALDKFSHAVSQLR